ncbi:hypothetical protein BD310DRAFT_282003 [Dichomitus squalens]|uniref:Uncharacterized protein n=1 Tax=Dichomitus squalens TaxID=114155 RepID=A0A4Q9QD98_9APHY|nr:hypothetical protein BD310DRAFT_282003 [Dichomitus squalens]
MLLGRLSAYTTLFVIPPVTPFYETCLLPPPDTQSKLNALTVCKQYGRPQLSVRRLMLDRWPSLNMAGLWPHRSSLGGVGPRALTLMLSELRLIPACCAARSLAIGLLPAHGMPP